MQRAERNEGERKTPGRRVNDTDRTKSDILDVAATHFATYGLSGSRVDDIAEQTHTSKRMLYYHYGSKEGLYRAVLAQAYANIRKHEAAIDLDAMPPREGLARLCEITFDHHRTNPDFVRLVMVENIHRGQHIAEVEGIEERAASVIGIIGKLLQRGRDAGVFRAGIDPLDLHLTMSGLAFYNVSNRYTLSHIFRRAITDDAIVARRRAVVVETILRWVCIAP